LQWKQASCFLSNTAIPIFLNITRNEKKVKVVLLPAPLEKKTFIVHKIKLAFFVIRNLRLKNGKEGGETPNNHRYSKTQVMPPMNVKFDM
jgi:hypothetical protein